MQGYEASYRPEPSPWDERFAGPGFVDADDGIPVKRSRPWLIALVAAVTLLAAIAAVGNQALTDIVQRHVTDGGRTSFVDDLLAAAIQFRWRFTPPDPDVGRGWAASLAFIGAAVVLTALLTAVTTRGRGGFGHLLVAVWGSVTIATMLATYVRATVLDRQAFDAQGSSAARWVFFGSTTAGPYPFAAGLGYGLVVGLVAATVGATARRTDLVGERSDVSAVPPGPAYQPPQPAAQQPAPAPYGGGEQHTAVLPPVDAPIRGDAQDGDETRALPRQRPPGDTDDQGRQR